MPREGKSHHYYVLLVNLYLLSFLLLLLLLLLLFLLLLLVLLLLLILLVLVLITLVPMLFTILIDNVSPSALLLHFIIKPWFLSEVSPAAVEGTNKL